MVLFDLDGTVANTIPLILESYAHATRTVLGRSAPPEETRNWIGQTLRDTFEERYPHVSDELLTAYRTWNEANLERLIRRYEGMAELLADLQDAGLTTGIVTSKRRNPAEATLSGVGLAGRVPVLTAMEDTTRHKPAADPLLHALGRLERRPDECVYVGDATFDVRCATAAGADAVAVTWGAGYADELAAENPLAVVDTVDSLRELLLG